MCNIRILILRNAHQLFRMWILRGTINRRTVYCRTLQNKQGVVITSPPVVIQLLTTDYSHTTTQHIIAVFRCELKFPHVLRYATTLNSSAPSSPLPSPPTIHIPLYSLPSDNLCCSILRYGGMVNCDVL